MYVYDSGQAMNAFAQGSQLGTQMRNRQTQNAFAGYLKDKDYAGAQNYALGRGSLELAKYAETQGAAQTQQADAQKTAKLGQLKSLTENMLTIPEAQRGEFLSSNWQDIEPIVGTDFMTFWNATGGDVSDASLNEDLAMFRVQMGEGAPVQQAPAGPIEIGGRLVDPESYEVLYEPPAKKPEPMSAYQSARIAIDRAKLAADKGTAAQPDDPWSALALGDGNGILYNSETGESRALGAQPVQAAPGEDPNALLDDFSSPFEGQDFAPYGGALLTPASFGDQFSGEGLPPLVTGGEGAPTGRKPTEFDKVRDREAAKDLVEWQLGGQARAATQLGILKDVISELESGANVSGPWVGNLPLKSITAPNAKDVEARVASVVQQSLKAILGGQFAEREAQDLLKRAYDPTLDEKINAARLKTLYNDLVYRSQINDYAARYAEQYGTLEGVDAYLAQLGDHSPMQTPQNLDSMSDDDLLRSLGLQ